MRSHEESGGYGRWSPGVCLNIGANYLDRHVDAGAGERSALVWDSAISGVQLTFTYRRLWVQFARLNAAEMHCGGTRPRGHQD